MGVHKNSLKAAIVIIWFPASRKGLRIYSGLGTVGEGATVLVISHLAHLADMSSVWSYFEIHYKTLVGQGFSPGAPGHARSLTLGTAFRSSEYSQQGLLCQEKWQLSLASLALLWLATLTGQLFSKGREGSICSGGVQEGHRAAAGATR